jgi:hypothetical protein
MMASFVRPLGIATAAMAAKAPSNCPSPTDDVRKYMGLR